jgi:hypothetical protein
MSVGTLALGDGYAISGYDTMWQVGQGSGGVDSITLSAAPVPEPTTAILLCTGVIGLLAYAWRKRK